MAIELEEPDDDEGVGSFWDGSLNYADQASRKWYGFNMAMAENTYTIL